MHRVAEQGIAAHWKYKEKQAAASPIDAQRSAGSASSWSGRRTLKDPAEFLESVKVDLFQDEVYVFTPGGTSGSSRAARRPSTSRSPSTPRSASTCAGARVNGKLVPLRYKLRNGDVVEIVTAPNQQPSKDWLKIVKTPRARAKIHQWLKVEERVRSIELGREMFEREAKKYRLNPAPLMGGDDFKKVAADLGYATADDLLAAVGYGKASAHQLLHRLAPAALLEPQERPRPADTRPRTEQGVRIRGVEDLLVRFAKCCNPLPGDAIVGFITRGRGLTVHARDCLTVVKSVLDRERLISVEWDVEEPATRPVRIAVYIGRDRPGLLSEITGAISSRDGNITKAEVTVTDDRRGINHFVVEVADLGQLQAIMGAIRDVPDVINVERVRGL